MAAILSHFYELTPLVQAVRDHPNLPPSYAQAQFAQVGLQFCGI